MEEITWLIRGLEEAPAGTRLWHIEALGRTGNPAAAPPLCALLREEEFREAALGALEQLGEAAVEPLCRELKYGRRDIHLHVIRVLGRIGDTRAVPMLCEALKEKDWRLRAPALEALEEMGDPHAVPQLIEVLTGCSWETGERAAVALGNIGDARAVPALMEKLVDGHVQAAVALGKIALRDPVPELRAALPVLRSGLFMLSLTRGDEPGRTLRTAMERIEAATTRTNLPLPAAAPAPSVASLPLPAGPAAPEPEALPLPAAAPGSEDVQAVASRSEALGRSTDHPWWHGLHRWLRGDE